MPVIVNDHKVDVATAPFATCPAKALKRAADGIEIRAIPPGHAV
jgi:hypothetical protein